MIARSSLSSPITQMFKTVLDYGVNRTRTRVSLYARVSEAQNPRPKTQHLPCGRTKRVAYYLGIDGGGSKTTCAVGDEVSLLARVTTGPSNITRVGEGRAREALQKAIREACATARIPP